MPELPEMVVVARQMDQSLRGKQVEKIWIFQPKCLYRAEEDYHRHLPGKIVQGVRALGKWVEIDLRGGDRLLVSLGMGGEVCFLDKDAHSPEKSRCVLRFTDGTGFFITLWWFGYFHLVLKGEAHGMTDSLGPDPLMLSAESFKGLLNRRRGGIKSFLLNQKCLRGIGNFYIQEILYKARLHPLRAIPSMTEVEKDRLYTAIREVFEESIGLDSSSYELDFFGKKGRYGLDRLSIAYKEGAHCSVCGFPSEKIKTGSTTQYICPVCQKL